MIKRKRITFQRHRETILGYLFIAPVCLGLIIFILGPIIASLFLSFFEWDLFTPPHWVGFKNYVKIIFQDKLFWQSLKVTSFYVGGLVPLQMMIAFLLALFLNVKIKGLSFFRTTFYMPVIVPIFASAIIWLWILNPEFGLANALITKIGLPKLMWLESPRQVIPSLILMSLWRVGQPMIIFLAGLQGVPTQLYEVAEIDGATARSKFFNITVPLMTPLILFNGILGVIWSFQIFTTVYLITDGGPANASLTYILYTYRHAFEWLHIGYASALGWILFLIILGITVLIFKYFGRRVYYLERI